MSDSAYVRQSFLGIKGQRNLEEAVVGIVGNCGGGSHVAQQLAHIGIRRFRLVDPDRTSIVNLNRMVGSVPDDAVCERWKTDVLARMIRSINPNAEVVGLNTSWQLSGQELRSCDVIFGCVDGFGTRAELEAFARRFLIPYVDIGMDVADLGDRFAISGQVIASIPGRPCMWCMGFLTDDVVAQEAQKYGAGGPKPQVVWPNGMLASAAVGIGVALLTGWTDTSVPFLELDGNRNLLRASSRLGTCSGKTCPHYPVEEVGDPFWIASSGTDLRTHPP